jgi:hypothetical protein
LTNSFSNIGQRLKGGQFNPAELDSLNGTVDQIGSSAATAIGKPIRDVAIPDFGR